MLLGVDTGGTFTDFVLWHQGHLRVHKVLSTPDAPERAIVQGIAELDLNGPMSRGELTVIHGSTVATNAALERKGVRTLLVTNCGLADLLSIGRQTRPQLYELNPPLMEVPVAPEDCVEVGCRIGAGAECLASLTGEDFERLRDAIAERCPGAVAINLLFSFLHDEDEKALEDACPEGIFVSRSSFVLPEYREYERGMATWLNAYLGPRVAGYLDRLHRAVAPSPLGVMQSSGGTIDAAQASRRAVNLLLSGPAGGLAAARFFAGALNPGGSPEKLLTFDMGGTSTDVALVDGELKLTSEGRLGPFPVAVPMVDMHTIGAGGGSLAQVDAGGLLQVGPASAGADPGPACYGQGGSEATVTDANAVLGRLLPEFFLGGAMTLDRVAAEAAIDRLATSLGLDRLQTAQGIIRLANEHMVSALRVISVQRGYHPADFTLCCFGGAGGLHVCALAEELGMTRALVPMHGGVLSALGMLVAPRERQLSRSLQVLLDEVDSDSLERMLAELADGGHRELLEEGVKAADINNSYSVDLRYQGQSFCLNLPVGGSENLAAAFHHAHRQRYGHALDIPVELVNLRARVSAPAEPLTLTPLTRGDMPSPLAIKQLPVFGETRIYQRQSLPAGVEFSGPTLICEQVATTLIATGWVARVDDMGNLLLKRMESSR